MTRTIEHVSTECTLLVIAHRTSTIQTADSLVVLDAGRVIATGSPAEIADAHRLNASSLT